MDDPVNHGGDRRRFLLGMLVAPLAVSHPLGHSQPQRPAPSSIGAQQPGARLPPWTPGCLDIHHIATGRGNATFILMPDGTSLLIDAGATNNALDVSALPKPGAQFLARYHFAGALEEAGEQLKGFFLKPDEMVVFAQLT